MDVRFLAGRIQQNGGANFEEIGFAKKSSYRIEDCGP